MTNDLARRIGEHKSGIRSSFASFYRVGDLLYFEEYREAKEAIAREKEIKGWRREKKLQVPYDCCWSAKSHRMTLVERESPVACKALGLILSHPMTPSRQEESHRAKPEVKDLASELW